MRTDRLLLTIIAFALLVRAGMLYCNYLRHPDFFRFNADIIAEEISPENTPYVNAFGFEIGNIAYSLVCENKGFSSPFGGDTGPTGWAAPGTVMIYALAFSLFGCFSTKALLFMFGISMLLSALMLLFIYTLSLHLFNNRTIALFGTACFVFSLQDTELYYKWYQQDFNIYSFLFLLTFFLYYRFRSNPSAKHLLAFSTAAGLALYFLPALIFGVAGLWLMEVIVRHRNRIPVIRHAAISLIIICCIVSPYVIYQKHRLGTWFFMKSNAGFELYQGNSEVSDGYLTNEVFEATHPAANEKEFSRYKEKGETAYVTSKMEAFLNNFDFARFIQTTAKRFLYFFFIFRHYTDNYTLNFLMVLRYIGYALPGIALLLFPLLYRPDTESAFAPLYGYIAGFSFPYLCIAVMYRYSFPINTLASIVLGAILYKLIFYYSNS